MLNPRLQLLSEYPFDRLRTLLGGIEPPTGMAPMVLSVGEPRHAPPALVHDVVAASGDLWNRYPPVEGTPEFRAAAAGWLTRRYALPDGLLDADRHILPVAGTREALFLVAAVAVPRAKAGRQPAVLMPNPFYHVYFGATLMSGAEPLYFLDYYATGKLDVDTTVSVVGGIATGCELAGCALIGGETADLDDLCALDRVAGQLSHCGLYRAIKITLEE